MNFKKYIDVQIGDLLAKNGAFPQGKVIKTENWETACGCMCRLTLDNGDEWLGWAERTVKLQ